MQPPTAPEIACTLSHLHVWREVCTARELNSLRLVLEDDAQFIAPLATLHAALNATPRGWDLLYLARVPKMPAQDTRLNAHVVRPAYSSSTLAYLVTTKGACKLARAFDPQNLVAVDELLPALYSPHPREDMRAIHGTGRRIRAFATAVAMVAQTRAVAMTSDISPF